MNAILKPALHALWQTFLATLAVWWGASGATGINAIHNVDDAKRFALSGAAAGLAALASALYHTGQQYGPRLLSSVLPFKVNKAELASIYEVLDAAIAAQTPPPPALADTPTP